MPGSAAELEEPPPAPINCASWAKYRAALPLLTTSPSPLPEIRERFGSSASQLTSTFAALHLMVHGHVAVTEVRRLLRSPPRTTTYDILVTRLEYAVHVVSGGGFAADVDARLGAVYGGSPERLRRFIIAAAAEVDLELEVLRKPRGGRPMPRAPEGPNPVAAAATNIVAELDAWTKQLGVAVRTDTNEARQISRHMASLRRELLRLPR